MSQITSGSSVTSEKPARVVSSAASINMNAGVLESDTTAHPFNTLLVVFRILYVYIEMIYNLPRRQVSRFANYGSKSTPGPKFSLSLVFCTILTLY